MDGSKRPTLLELFFVFARVSAVTIGGGYVMFPMLRSEVVELKQWLSEEELVDYYALGQSVPGIIAINTAALIGYRKRGISGAVAAAVGMAAPSLVLTLLISALFVRYLDNVWVQKAFVGIRAAVVAMMLVAIWRVGRTAANGWIKAGIALLAFMTIAGLDGSPVLVLLCGALLGGLLFRKESEA